MTKPILAFLTPAVIARFWTKVAVAGPDDCWIWQAGRDIWGYGTFWLNGTSCHAQRVAYAIASCVEPGDLLVCHDCPGGDQPACVNSGHLWLGTAGENAADRHKKGRDAMGDRSGARLHPECHLRGDDNPSRRYPERLRRGEHCHTAKLTACDVLLIRQLYQQGGMTFAQLGKRFGVDPASISAVVKRRSWAHIS